MRASEETQVELLLNEPEIVKWLESDEQQDDDAKPLAKQRSLKTQPNRMGPRNARVR
jgi:hypothetical protein